MTPALAARVARPTDVEALADLAAETFPLACPPTTTAEAIRAHIRDRLSPAVIAGWLADPGATVIVVDGGTRLEGYALALTGQCEDPEAAEALESVGIATDPIHELSKIYVRADAHGRGIADTLMRAVLSRVAYAHGEGPMWLGTNLANHRAQAFYRRHGFTAIGSRTYRVGGHAESDVVMLRR